MNGKALLAMALSATALTTATSAQAAIRITSTVDSYAPAGTTPKLIFTASGVTKNRKYAIRWQTAADVPSSCTRFGSSIIDTAYSRTLEFDPLPGGSYDGGFYKPFCEGVTYKGRLRQQRASGAFRTAATFRFTAQGVI